MEAARPPPRPRSAATAEAATPTSTCRRLGMPTWPRRPRSRARPDAPSGRRRRGRDGDRLWPSRRQRRTHRPPRRNCGRVWVEGAGPLDCDGFFCMSRGRTPFAGLCIDRACGASRPECSRLAAKRSGGGTNRSWAGEARRRGRRHPAQGTIGTHASVLPCSEAHVQTSRPVPWDTSTPPATVAQHPRDRARRTWRPRNSYLCHARSSVTAIGAVTEVLEASDFYDVVHVHDLTALALGALRQGEPGGRDHSLPRARPAQRLERARRHGEDRRLAAVRAGDLERRALTPASSRRWGDAAGAAGLRAGDPARLVRYYRAKRWDLSIVPSRWCSSSRRSG